MAGRACGRGARGPPSWRRGRKRRRSCTLKCSEYGDWDRIDSSSDVSSTSSSSPGSSSYRLSLRSLSAKFPKVSLSSHAAIATAGATAAGLAAVLVIAASTRRQRSPREPPPADPIVTVQKSDENTAQVEQGEHGTPEPSKEAPQQSYDSSATAAGAPARERTPVVAPLWPEDTGPKVWEKNGDVPPRTASGTLVDRLVAAAGSSTDEDSCASAARTLAAAAKAQADAAEASARAAHIAAEAASRLEQYASTTATSSSGSSASSDVGQQSSSKPTGR